MKEKNMYPPIKVHLESLGFSIKAEVEQCDLVAKKDDLVIVVEMKTRLSFHLLYQGTKRQHISDFVYLAIIEPPFKTRQSKRFKEKLHILRRLHLGLLLVHLKAKTVKTVLDPKDYQMRTHHIKKKKLLSEFEQRITSFNTGGVHKTKIITAYREQALLVAHLLKDEPKSTKEIRDLLENKKSTSILQKNYYGWFERVKRGVYKLSEVGYNALNEYSKVIHKLIQEKEIA